MIKKLLLSLLLLCGMGLPIAAQPSQMTFYTGLYFDSGTTVPGNCSIPAYFWNTSNSSLYVCTASKVFAQAGGGGSTFQCTFQGANYQGTAVFGGNVPSTNFPTAKINSGGTLAVLDFPSSQSVDYWYGSCLVPSNYTTNSAIKLKLESACDPANCDSTNAANVYVSLSCTGGSARADAPSFTESSTPVAITNAVSGNQVLTTINITPNSTTITGTTGNNTNTFPACAAGNRVTVKVRVDTSANSLTGSLQLISTIFGQ